MSRTIQVVLTFTEVKPEDVIVLDVSKLYKQGCKNIPSNQDVVNELIRLGKIKPEDKIQQFSNVRHGEIGRSNDLLIPADTLLINIE